ncbi:MULTISPECIES: hypothetical protein [Mycobacteroides]|uniref:Uncharacterized protein n=1 Tax=Mycobacteroides immunogenum TaxID=83262 RepID=A0A7V8LMP3_9MYCO|nr:hypothetical protein [Mycobacteroides immunogenum]AMT72629.1 hypothetical protein ABG82_22545 [Mycobacteroides immunogenum]ANO05794.1 hypothetical protein BAB75_22825 [Mycobacteroides immunogenum]KIU41050.1 hypothetical protein TL11_08235 [Mycobacteroides immunogenum]KPG05957.1 hypothetical protein AN909_19545 [Mycobacteroides immunogenum]KPG07605.1 hypothetical protein AN908_19025 [Mycobacteroides immunogenum]
MTPLRIVAGATMAICVATVLAPPAGADETADLRSAVSARRGNCAALQPDPVLDQVAQVANHQTQKYINHASRFEPMEDPMPMLRQLSYPAGKAKLLFGYADVHKFADAPQKAIYGAALFGSEVIPDCTYTRYGADVLTDPNTGKTTTAIVLAGD